MTLVIEFSCAAICILLMFIFPAGNRKLLLLVAAFILSYIGDRFLSSRGNSMYFVYGIGFYFIAHACFLLYALIAISKGRFSWPLLAAVTFPYLIFYFVALTRTPLLKENSVLAAAVLLYVLISCFSMAASVDFRGGLSLSLIFTAGIFCLLVSDTLIALGRFLQNRRFYFMMMPLFYTSHILIVLSVTLKNILHRN